MKLIRRDPDLGYIDTMLWLPKKLVNVDGLKKALEFELSDHDAIRVLRLWEEAEHHLIVPRAFLKPSDINLKCVDCRPKTFARAKIISRIKLDHKKTPTGIVPTGKTLQRRAVETLLRSNGGTLQLACGTGKTVVALHLASLMKVPTLIIVDNTHLMEQWQDEIETHLEVPGGVGLIQGQVKDWKKSVVMATYQTLANWADTMPEEVRRWFGLIIWDEGHHVSAPRFSKSAPLFYGYRLALTATPNRQDGMNVICEHHVGGVIFKDVVQDYPPKIQFKWTGFTPDMENPAVAAAICDVNGELHLGKVAGYFGANRERLTQVVLPEVKDLLAKGHKVLVLSYSVDEVINLQTLWTSGDVNAPLYTDIPYPRPEEVGETLQPIELKPSYEKRLIKTVQDIKRNLAMHPNLQPAKRTAFEERLATYEENLAAFAVWKKTEKLYRKRQREFLKNLLTVQSDAGLFTNAVDSKERFKMLRERKVIFAIMKYGREGLDDNKLSAILASQPVSDRGVLQQIMGRPRDKKHSELIFLEDNIGPLIGQCQKLRRHLRDWPADEGGPFKYEQIGHPATFRRRGIPWNQGTDRATMRAQATAMRAPGSL